jgi:hypothetical protein
MDEPQWREEIAPRISMAQIIIAGMVTGCLIFLAIALVIVLQTKDPNADQTVSVLTYVAAIVAASAIIVRFVVPAAIMSRGRENIAKGTWQSSQSSRTRVHLDPFLDATGDAGKLWLLFLTRTILCGAVLEGAAFVCLVVYLIDHSNLALAVAVALIVGLALHFPTRNAVIFWIEDQLRIIDLQRGTGR